MIKISEVADKVGMGPFGSSIKVSTFVPGGIPVISGQHLTKIRLEDNGYNFITDEHAKRLKSANVYRGDVIFTHAGNIGQVAFIPEDSKYQRYVISQRQFFMRCNRDKVIPSFVSYYFKTHEGQHKLLANASSTGVPSIVQPVTYLRTVEIPVPSLTEQRAIVNILSSFDDKIELNRQMNMTLEAMARTVFKSWFVDPIESEFPNGWCEGTINDFADLNPESWSEESFPNEIEYVDLANTKWGKIEATARYSRGNAPSRAQRILKPGDSIVGTVRPGNGSFAFICQTGLTASTGFAVLRPRKSTYKEFVYLATTSNENIEWLSHLADGAAYPAVRPNVVVETPVIRPTEDVVTSFSNLVGPLLSTIALNNQESRTLAAIRDALLPKLMSGELVLGENS